MPTTDIQVRQEIAQEFMNSFTLDVNVGTLRAAAPRWVEEVVNDVARTGWDYLICYYFAEEWAKKNAYKFVSKNRCDEFAYQFANTCVQYHAPRAIEWLTEDKHHMDSADDYLEDIDIRELERRTIQEIFYALTLGGQEIRATIIARQLWRVLEDRLRDTINGV